ncbi:Nitrogen fixation protein of unknown function [Prochlorococcus marinus str. MIT 1342]|uniref:Nif11-like leader peptide family natural product precursor n=1 Tax=Prochlorococcus TaxID=1218 RepID=UPI0007B399E3|nr:MULTISPECIES: Nif11-like leader peptide family natural product precursor [Prochlorococcus]KZR65682.1 Nitrogen fixation protein of unknown function [Prochlorococcus sp. MIT 1303]KZR77548.1 Nitrogen fixation protein of unknown function [Prochlorococcus marinus str. MIT 1323]KZR82495.1 Nitrogen fixation protein of unknown function [Prochlorococcus marinus str. MIT 1342]
MSEAHLKAFMTMLRACPSLEQKLKTEGTDVLMLAKAAGYTVTMEDLEKGIFEYSGTELSHDERGYFSSGYRKEMNG